MSGLPPVVVNLDLGETAKPVDTITKKLFKLLGDWREPGQILRIAKAQAEADLIAAKSRIEINDLERRAVRRWIGEESRKQENIESIKDKALKYLIDGADADGLDDDWTVHFVEKCRLTSDDEVQQYWAKILAGEVNHPGAFSRKAVNLLSDLDKRDAELFSNLCCFCWKINRNSPVIFHQKTTDVYSKEGIDQDSLRHLESLGLIHIAPAMYRTLVPASQTSLKYFNTKLLLTFPDESERELIIGNVLFTRPGRELAQVCNVRPIPGFVEHVAATWWKKNVASLELESETSPPPEPA